MSEQLKFKDLRVGEFCILVGGSGIVFKKISSDWDAITNTIYVKDGSSHFVSDNQKIIKLDEQHEH